MINSVLCANGTHVYSAGSLRCQCGAAANGNTPKYVTITYRVDTDTYFAYHPELPNVISQASTPEEARANLIEATEMAVHHLIDNGLPVPQPMPFPLAVDFAHEMAMAFPPNVTVAPFTGYHPAGYRPPKPDPAPETSLEQLRAAQRAGASWLSADGKFAYCERYGAVLKAEWDGANFGVWWPVEGEMPAEAVRL